MSFIRKVWPKHSLADRCGFSFTHCGLTFIICFQWFTVLPLYHKPFTEMYCLHVSCGLFILFQVFMNLYELLLSDTTVESLGEKYQLFYKRIGIFVRYVSYMYPQELIIVLYVVFVFLREIIIVCLQEIVLVILTTEILL